MKFWKMLSISFLAWLTTSTISHAFSVSVLHQVPLDPFKNCNRLGYESDRMEFVRGTMYFLDSNKGLCVTTDIKESPGPLPLDLSSAPYELVGFFDFKIVYPMVYLLGQVRNSDSPVIAYNLETKTADFSLPRLSRAERVFADDQAVYVRTNYNDATMVRIDLHSKAVTELQLPGTGGIGAFTVVGDEIFYAPYLKGGEDMNVFNWRNSTNRAVKLNAYEASVASIKSFYLEGRVIKILASSPSAGGGIYSLDPDTLESRRDSLFAADSMNDFAPISESTYFLRDSGPLFFTLDLKERPTHRTWNFPTTDAPFSAEHPFTSPVNLQVQGDFITFGDASYGQVPNGRNGIALLNKKTFRFQFFPISLYCRHFINGSRLFVIADGKLAEYNFPSIKRPVSSWALEDHWQFTGLVQKDGKAYVSWADREWTKSGIFSLDLSSGAITEIATAYKFGSRKLMGLRLEGDKLKFETFGTYFSSGHHELDLQTGSAETRRWPSGRGYDFSGGNGDFYGDNLFHSHAGLTMVSGTPALQTIFKYGQDVQVSDPSRTYDSSHGLWIDSKLRRAWLSFPGSIIDMDIAPYWH